MNSEHYHRGPQLDGLSFHLQYARSSRSSNQATHRMLSFDGLPRTQPEHTFMDTPASKTNVLPSNYDFDRVGPMSMSPSSAAWSGQNPTTSAFDHQALNNFFGYSTHLLEDADHDAFHQGSPEARVNFRVPRFLPQCTSSLLDSNIVPDAYDSSGYMLDPKIHENQSTSFGRPNMPHTALDHSNEFARLSISGSPKLRKDDVESNLITFDNAPSFRLPSSELLEDGGFSSRETTTVEADEQAADQPYAKLIYRALMSAPNHSMVLQEIYQWFRDNTVKASSDTKGWMNSIRHNLSMNAAFKKTERKVSGDETKKSTEWVLEEFAIKDGVQSTTRYRKGTGAKKFVKSETPTPARQTAGRKGGFFAARNKSQRQRVKEDRADPRGVSQKVDFARRSEFQQQTRAHIADKHADRHRTPLTPPNPEMMPRSQIQYKAEQIEMPYDDYFHLGNVQGVYSDDGPLFSDDRDGHYLDGHSF